ncbi:unnamed protein product [Prorocentrum cordatum]|uniref:Uncharacterized protein n=1 Tax=Prorocentrum cordatum TaxID=2364126 RepID=A0ABN9WVY4_9DINO|nr:unnamed protein product [Polarella glacialis]
MTANTSCTPPSLCCACASAPPSFYVTQRRLSDLESLADLTTVCEFVERTVHDNAVEGITWGGGRLTDLVSSEWQTPVLSHQCPIRQQCQVFVRACSLKSDIQCVNYLPRFRFQAKPSHTTRLLVKRSDQYRP